MHGRPVNKAEFEQELERVEAIIGDPQKRKELVETTGDDAQEWLDLLQLLAEYPEIPKTLRSSIFKIIIRLSQNSRLHPKCLTIQDVEKLGDHPEAGGAFADVWKGRIGGNLVCIKMIRAFSTFDVEQSLRDYMQEAIVWRQLNHRNLLPFMGIFYFDNDRKRLCLVSPWMERGNLVQFLRTSPPELVDREMLVYDVACGLSYLHGLKIAHGDLKGVNILITPDLRACIGDFGLSRIAETQSLFASQASHSKGTIRWLPPEMLKPGPSHGATKESDVYAYGCVCYEIFAGHIPFLGLSDAAVLFAVLLNNERPPRPEGLSRSHDSLWSMITVCWDVDPSSRPTMADVLTRLAAINTKLDRTLEAAPGWDNPRYTQIWNDIQHPTLLQAVELPVSPPPSLNITDFGGTNAQEEEGMRQKEVQRWQKEESGKHQQLADKVIQRKREEEETQRELGEVKRPEKRATREKADPQWRQQEQSRAEAGRNSMAEESGLAEWVQQVQQEREEEQRRPEQDECEDADGGSREAAVDTCLDTNETLSPEMPPQPANLPRLAVPPRPHLKTIQTKVPPTPLQPTQNNAMLQATPWESRSHHLLPHDSPQPLNASPNPSYQYQYPNPARTPEKSAPPQQNLQASMSSANSPFRALPLLSTDLPHTKISVSHSFIHPNDRGKEVVSFIVHVDPGRGKEGWKAEKMYSHVLSLDKRVRASVAKGVGKKIAVLPEGKLWKDHAPAKVGQRKAVLENYLQTLINLPVKTNDEVVAFFTTDIVKETMQPVMQAGYKEGYLTKRGKNFGGWKTRFFVVQGHILEYYDCRGGTHLGSINVAGAQIGRQQRNPSSASADDEKEYRHAFLIVEAKKGAGGNHPRHVLCAESDEERDSWVEILVRYFSGAYSEEPVTYGPSPSQPRPSISKDALGGVLEKPVAPAPPKFLPRAVFGVALEESLGVAQIANLPAVVFRCIQYLEANMADQQEGIYQHSGSSAVIQRLKDRFNVEGDIDLIASDEYWDPHAIAGLLKSYLQELPASILTQDLHVKFLSVIEYVDPQERIRELSHLIATLPVANYSLLQALAAYLILLVQNSAATKMTMRNVAYVFSPTLGIPRGVLSLMLGEFNRVFIVEGDRAANGTASVQTDRDSQLD